MIRSKTSPRLTFDEDNSGATHEDGAITIEEEGWESVRLSTRYSFTARMTSRSMAARRVRSISRSRLRRSHDDAALQTGQSVRVGCLAIRTHCCARARSYGCARIRRPANVRAASGSESSSHSADEAAIEAFIIMRADV